MRIGLSGYHGCGKSTLMKAFAKKNGFQTIPSVANRVFDRYGLSQSDILDLATRMKVQEEILERQIDAYIDPPESSWCNQYIADRTPMDMMAYTNLTFGDATSQHYQYHALQARREMYTNLCVSASRRHFDFVVMIPFVIPFEDSIKRPAFDERQKELFEIALEYSGLTSIISMPKDIITVEDRVAYLEDVVKMHSGGNDDGKKGGRP